MRSRRTLPSGGHSLCVLANQRGVPLSLSLSLITANRKVLVNMDEDGDFLSGELPDGMTIDVKGNLWVAMFNGKRIVNIDGKTGKVIDTIEMPTSMITSVCFGGPNLDEMYATSVKKFLDEERKATQPLAGYIFKITSSKSEFKGFQPNYNMKL